MKRFVYIERLVPAVGLIRNAARYRGLHCGLRVEIQGPGELKYGARVRVGEGTRLDLPKDSVLEIGSDVSISRFAHIVPEAEPPHHDRWRLYHSRRLSHLR